MLNPQARFAAVHLDIEPHTLPENQGAPVETYLPAFIETLLRARNHAARLGLGIGADVPRTALLAPLALRQPLVRAVPRLFLMLYQLAGRTGGFEDAGAELALTSARLVRQAYEGIGGDEPGELVVGVSADDYPGHVGEALGAVEDSCGPDPRFGGWALHDLAGYVRGRN